MLSSDNAQSQICRGPGTSTHQEGCLQIDCPHLQGCLPWALQGRHSQPPLLHPGLPQRPLHPALPALLHKKTSSLQTSYFSGVGKNLHVHPSCSHIRLSTSMSDLFGSAIGTLNSAKGRHADGNTDPMQQEADKVKKVHLPPRRRPPLSTPRCPGGSATAAQRLRRPPA